MLNPHRANIGWVTDTEPSRRFPVYTRANAEEVYAGVLTPLAWSISVGWPSERGWRQALIEFGAFEPSEFSGTAMDLIASFGGYIYLNLSVSRIMGLRTPGTDPQAVDRAFFGDLATVPTYEPQPGDDDPRAATRLLDRFHWVMTTKEVPGLDEARDMIDALPGRRPSLAAMSPDLLVSYVRSLLDEWYPALIARHFFIIHCATVPTGTVQTLSSDLGRDDLAMRLMSGLGGVDSAAPSLAMWTLAQRINESRELTRIFDLGSVQRWSNLQGSHDPVVQEFVAEFRNFLTVFGSRGPDEWDVSVHSWETDPGSILPAIGRMRNVPVEESPANRLAERVADRLRAMDELRSILAARPEALAEAETAVASAAVWLSARERSKTTIIRLFNEVRLAIHELGRQMIARGVISSITELSMLEVDELALLSTAPDDVSALIAERSETRAALAKKVPPYFVDGVVPPLASWEERSQDCVKVQIAQPGDRLPGISACPGKATGIARVIMSPDMADELNDGDVLIAPYTDPAWTPLFVSVAAVVVDVGAPMSHAAIISRELGVPCVVSCADATRRIPDGANITVDGTSGMVYVH